MAKEKKPTKDPKKQQGKRTKRIGHKTYLKTFKDARGLTVEHKRKKYDRKHNENPRDWGKLDSALRELSKAIRRFDSKKVVLEVSIPTIDLDAILEE